MKLRIWRRPDPIESNHELGAAAEKLAEVAADYEELREQGIVRNLDPVDLERIRTLGIEIDVQGRDR